MSLSFTELNTGDTIIVNKSDIQFAVNLEEFCQLELITGVIVDLSNPWSYVYSQINGGPPPVAP